ncbi:DNA lyase [Hoeflea sp. AS60]|uniref:8-oxoguanine DNA glycosylase n=1 Tax=Hoeflea sp. AS60 TaxID=3135780 RepID=UPI00319D95A4
MKYDAAQIMTAVASICPEIQQRVDRTTPCGDERSLWWELSSCVLSSQVPYSLATAAADAIDQSNLLFDPVCDDQLEVRLEDVLRKPLTIAGRLRTYRFPSAKAAQLARTYYRIHCEADSLSSLLAGFSTASDARKWLVDHAPGLGPKQASMFLRNIGTSYDLAVIDRHVLRYMEITGVLPHNGGAITSLKRYRNAESTLRTHADSVTCSVGIMDWAIWIVMRVAKQSEVQQA